MDEQFSQHLPSKTILHDKYRIEKMLGHGGFGITYLGTEIRIGLRVAIKEYYPHNFVSRSTGQTFDVFANADERSRNVFEKGKKEFLEEARKLAQCEPIASVVGVRDYFEENRTAYIVMEYLEGVTLKKYAESHKTIDAEWLCRLMIPLLRDLDKVHRLSILHRDISPDNLMLVEEERLRLMDFGAARCFDADANQAMTVMLKPGYAPYEQYTSNGKQGPWTDVYSIGATIYACITGTAPDSATDRKQKDNLRKPRSLNNTISPALERVILKSLQMKGNDRYQSAKEMAEALSDAIPGTPKPVNQNNGTAIIQNAGTGKPHGPGNDRRIVNKTKQTVLDNTSTGSAPDPGWKRLGAVLLGIAAAVVLLCTLLPKDSSSISAATPTPMPISTPVPTPMPTPMPTPVPTPVPTPTPAPRVILPGDTVTLGRFDHDGSRENGAEAIEWRVLTVKDGKALLISRYALEQINFHSVKETVSWETCSLREWLNGTFLQVAFDDQERQAILITSNSNEESDGIPERATGGSITQDYLFLLSYKEAARYFKDKQDRIAFTRLPSGASSGTRAWWLRSISETGMGTAVVERDGRCTATRAVVYEDIYVRPAMWISIDQLP